MTYLLDTHALFWAVVSPEQLPARAHYILEAEEICASVVSYWELVLKKERRGAPVLNATAWWERYVTRAAVEVLPIRVKHIDRLATLPAWHGDPFDRMLIAQALEEDCTLISGDAIVARYGARVVWN